MIEDNGGPGLTTDVDEVVGGLFLVDSTVEGNAGAGVRVRNAAIFRSAIVGNRSDACGGGVVATQDVRIVATTVSGNRAPEGGGVCLRYSDFLGGATQPGLQILGSTITANEAGRGGGVSVDTSRLPIGCLYQFVFQESIIAGNEAIESRDCHAPAVVVGPDPGVPLPSAISSGHNLIGDGTGCEVDPEAGDLIGGAEWIDPGLLPLGDYGGPTPTHALAPGSPAHDAIPVDRCDASEFAFAPDGFPGFFLRLAHDTDQRGVVRPQQAACDVGAFERQPPRAIEIDVRPGSRRNRVNPRSRGLVPVAILGSEDFDVARVDVDSLAFGPEGAAPVGRFPARLVDLNRDGALDLLARFRVSDTGIAFGAVQACLYGHSDDARGFAGCDEVRTPRRAKRPPRRSVWHGWRR